MKTIFEHKDDDPCDDWSSEDLKKLERTPKNGS